MASQTSEGVEGDSSNDRIYHLADNFQIHVWEAWTNNCV